MKKAIDIVKENIEQFRKYNCYFVEASEIHTSKEDGRKRSFRIQLQIFTDDSGNVKMIKRRS